MIQQLDQLDLLSQEIPLQAPYWGGSGMWCCPRCFCSKLPSSLVFMSELDYRLGRCWDCGYWARFECAFGSTKGKLHGKGKVVSFGVEKGGNLE